MTAEPRRETDDPDLITTEEFAGLARAPISTVRYWRGQGIGPVGFKIGKRVLYRRRDVHQWIEDRHRAATKASA